MRRVKIFRTISIVFGLLVLILFLYSLVNFTFLKNQLNDNFGNQVESYGLIAVFILVFLLEILPQPFVSSIIPFTNGLLLGLDFTHLLIVTLVGVVLSNLFAYYLGISFGKKLTLLIIGEENYDGAYDKFKKYGKIGMAILALTPIPYFPILGGIFKMNLFDFIKFAIVPRTLNILVFSFILLLIF